MVQDFLDCLGVLRAEGMQLRRPLVALTGPLLDLRPVRFTGTLGSHHSVRGMTDQLKEHVTGDFKSCGIFLRELR
ncbi:hypothetical protein [Streptomyces tubercidicus]|uniref:hypothetical protein n=1 Tax=Streptomyces tubercidicus TaxID=47759 RepID=UPI00346509F7